MKYLFTIIVSRFNRQTKHLKFQIAKLRLEPSTGAVTFYALMNTFDFLFLQYGQMEIINHTHGIKCIVNFKPCGWFGREANKVEGAIYSKR